MKDLWEIIFSGLSGIGFFAAIIIGLFLAYAVFVLSLAYIIRFLPLIIAVLIFLWFFRKKDRKKPDETPDQPKQPQNTVQPSPQRPVPVQQVPVQPAVPVKPKPVFTPDLNFRHEAAPKPRTLLGVRKLKPHKEFQEMEKQMLFK